MSVSSNYRKFRRAGWHASQAFSAAKTLETWQSIGGFVADDESDDGGGATVRLRVAPDEHYEAFDSDCGPGNKECVHGRHGQVTECCPRHQLERDSLERDGAWGIIAEYIDDNGNWQHADSCWGFVGYRNPADPVQNAYVVDLMQSALGAVNEVSYAI
jgi:hypothetical protein